jgi:hypothetical protein
MYVGIQLQLIVARFVASQGEVKRRPLRAI